MRWSTEEENRRIHVLRRMSKEVRQYRVLTKILRTAAIMIAALLGILYIIAALYKNTGSFTVSLNKMEMTEYGLTLSESREMTHKTSHLNAKIAEDITNIAEESLPDNLDMIDGEHNGRDYIAYTFYLQNAGSVPVSYDYSVGISNVSNDLDEAIRVRLYKDGEYTNYAKTRSDGTGAERGTKEFYSSTLAAKERVENFVPGEITKFTVVIWIEGNDPDCIDYLIGGQLRVDMIMEIVH